MYVCTYETLILNASTQDSSSRSTLEAIHHLGYKTQILSEKGNLFCDSFQYAFIFLFLGSRQLF